MNTDAHELQTMLRDAADVYRLSIDDIAGPRRDGLAFAARSWVIARALDDGFTSTFLSHFFGRDHTSVLNSARRHRAQAAATPVFQTRRRPNHDTI